MGSEYGSAEERILQAYDTAERLAREAVDRWEIARNIEDDFLSRVEELRAAYQHPAPDIHERDAEELSAYVNSIRDRTQLSNLADDITKTRMELQRDQVFSPEYQDRTYINSEAILSEMEDNIETAARYLSYTETIVEWMEQMTDGMFLGVEQPATEYGAEWELDDLRDVYGNDHADEALKRLATDRDD